MNRIFYISMFDQVKLGLSVQRPIFMADIYNLRLIKCPAYGNIARGKIIVQGKMLIVERYSTEPVFEVSVFETIMFHNKNKYVKPKIERNASTKRRAKRIVRKSSK